MFKIDQEYLDTLFPASRTNEFFELLFGDADEGAYDIKLTLAEQSENKVVLNYELHGRPNKCLACNLTTGLPNVFMRHPTIATQKTADIIAEKMQWGKNTFEIAATKQISTALHIIPLTITKA